METYAPENQIDLYPCITIVALQFLSNFIRNQTNPSDYWITHNREQSEQNRRKIFSFFLMYKYIMFPAFVLPPISCYKLQKQQKLCT